MDKVLLDRISEFTQQVDNINLDQQSQIRTKQTLEEEMRKILADSKIKSDELDVVTNAISILRLVSDNSVRESYEFITEAVNSSLSRIFDKTTRKIRLNEYTRQGQYPQLELILEVENGRTRSLKLNSGRGLTQIISLLCILTLIVITQSRRILLMDEILSGLSARSRAIISDILWAFTEIGFQFIICEHGFIPKGSKVYELENKDGIGIIKDTYTEKSGVYLTYDYGTEIEQVEENE